MTPEQVHWQGIYGSRSVDAVSWYRPHLDASLELLQRAGLSPATRLIDVGGGASTLVDDLLARGLVDVTVLDIAQEALAVAVARLGERAGDVRWLAGDVLQVELPAGGYDLWHDRAVSHFLTDPDDAAAYAGRVAAAVRPGGHAVIGGFAPDGPQRCSGLPVVRRSADDVARWLGADFILKAARRERHVTPAGAVQSFEYALLERR